MFKITKEDLEQLFSLEHHEKVDDKKVAPARKIGIHKNSRANEHELVLKKIRKKIRRIPDKKTYTIPWESILKFTAVAGFSGFAFFALMNFPAYLAQINWIYHVDYLGETISSSPTPTATTTPTSSDSLTLPNLPNQPQSDENSISIPKIAVSAPIAWDVPEDNILENLKNGVVHYSGTSLPGEGGNIFIVGHSSNYFWIKSDYNQIFTLLDKLSPGDRIEIKKNGRSYFYDVFQSKVVSSEDVSILQSSQSEILTLMTCWPVGTSLNRLVIQSKYAYSAN